MQIFIFSRVLEYTCCDVIFLLFCYGVNILWNAWSPCYAPVWAVPYHCCSQRFMLISQPPACSSWFRPTGYLSFFRTALHSLLTWIIRESEQILVAASLLALFHPSMISAIRVCTQQEGRQSLQGRQLLSLPTTRVASFCRYPTML